MEPTNDTKTIEILERLLSGESPEALSRAYPEMADVIEEHAAVLRELSMVASITPPTDGLSRVVGSLRAHDAQVPTQTSYAYFSSFFSTYRTVLVLPVLVLMLIATGAVVLPPGAWRDGDMTEGEDAARVSMQMGVSATDMQTAQLAFSAPESTQPTAPALMKSMVAPEPQPAPQDQNLASVFGNEMQSDSALALQDSEAAAQSANDSQEVANYQDAYDGQAL